MKQHILGALHHACAQMMPALWPTALRGPPAQHSHEQQTERRCERGVGEQSWAYPNIAELGEAMQAVITLQLRNITIGVRRESGVTSG